MPNLHTLVTLEISKMFHKRKTICGFIILILLFLMMSYSVATHDEYHEQSHHPNLEDKPMETVIEKVENEKNTFTVLTRFFLSKGPILIPLIVIIVASETISGEYEQGTIKLILIKPFTRSKVYISKYIALMLFGLALIILISLVGYILGGLFLGYAFLVTNFQFLLTILGLFTISLAVIVALAMLISVYTKSGTTSLVVTIGLIVIGKIISSMYNQKYLVRYLPMAHFDVIKHLDGKFWIDGVTLSFSIVMLMFYGTVFFLIGIYGFTRRDII